MRRVELSAFLEAPVGCYTREAPFVMWAYSPELAGITYAARIGDEHLPLGHASDAHYPGTAGHTPIRR